MSKAGKLRLGLVNLSRSCIVISQYSHSLRAVCKIIGGLTKHLLGPPLIALPQNHLNKSFPRTQTLWIGSDGFPAYLFGVLQTVVSRIERGEQKFGAHRLRIERDRLFQFVFNGDA